MVDPVGPLASARLKSVGVRRQLAKVRTRVALASLTIGLPCALSALSSPPMLLVWNASASTPRGLYRVFPGTRAQQGDWVVAQLPTAFRALAARRRYLPLGVPLVKRVAAVGGDRICADGPAISINGQLAAILQPWDGEGRALPRWTGCRTLAPADLLLLGDSPWSFDGRYFGATKGADVIGRAVLLWRR